MQGRTVHPAAPEDASAWRGLPLANRRDLGGIAVAGGRIRHGLLWRSDDLCLSPRDEVRGLAERGLRLAIDLRSAEELHRTGRGHGPAFRIGHRHLPLTRSTADPAALAKKFSAIDGPEGVGRWYASLLERRAGDLVEALRLVAGAAGGVLFHCTAGKDRTGVLAAALLSCLGAESDAIITDYALTAANMPAVISRISAAGPQGRGGTTTVFDRFPGHPILDADADNMRSMLERTGGPHGIARLLRNAGFDDDLRAALARRLVE